MFDVRYCRQILKKDLSPLNSHKGVFNMKRLIALLTAVFAVCLIINVYAEEQPPAVAPAPAVAAAPAAPAPDVTGSVSFTGLNKYIFRGAELSAKSVVLEPSVTINYKGFSLNVWAT